MFCVALLACRSWLIVSIVWLVVAFADPVFTVGIIPDGFESSEAKTRGDMMDNRSTAARNIRIGRGLLNNQPDDFSLRRFKPIG